MNGHLFVICGASGSGKSTLTEMISQSMPKIERAPKYSTRKCRKKTAENPVTDDIISVDRENFFNKEYDLAYVANDNYYGINSREILELISKNKTLLLSITDFRAVFRLKNIFGDQCTTISLLSAIDQYNFIATHGSREKYSPEDQSKREMQRLYRALDSAGRLNLWREVFASTISLLKTWQMTVPDFKEAESRVKKVRNFQTKFLENSHHFDFTILNYRQNSQTDMLKQFERIYNVINHGFVKSPPEKNTLLVVAAASGSGKGTLPG